MLKIFKVTLYQYKLVCNLMHMHGTFKNNHNYIYIYINFLLIDYELKNKLKLTFRIIVVKIEIVMPRQHFLRDQSLHQNNLEKSLTKTILLRRVALLVFLYTQLNSSQSNLAYSNLTSTAKLTILQCTNLDLLVTTSTQILELP